MTIDDLVSEFLKKESNVADLRQIVFLLKRSGLLEVIRKMGYPRVVSNGSDLNAMAHEGSWSNGFQTALNQIEYFEKYYTNKPDLSAATVKPSFGGKEVALKNQYLSDEDLKKLKEKGVIK